MTPTVVLVGGGKGGVGKSTVTAGLARQLIRLGSRVGVLDADLSGPSQARIFRCIPASVANGARIKAASTESVVVASIGLVAHQGTALVWSDVTASAAVRMLALEADWSNVEILLVDLPPGHGRIATELAEIFPSAVALLVTTGSELALEECRRAGTFMRRMEIRPLGIIDNLAFVRCKHCGETSPLFNTDGVAAVAQDLELTVIAKLPLGDVVEGDGLDPVARIVEAEQIRSRRSSDDVA